VQALTKKLKGPVLCFVGPPGVGKTSLAKSIARATGRKFVRLSLGGVRDEAEIGREPRRSAAAGSPRKSVDILSTSSSRNRGCWYPLLQALDDLPGSAPMYVRRWPRISPVANAAEREAPNLRPVAPPPIDSRDSSCDAGRPDEAEHRP